MKQAWILALLLSWAPTSGAQPEPVRKPVKRAVLIGIERYQEPSIESVPGALNDLELMRTLLEGKFEFDPRDIVAMRNEQAKHEAILATIRTHLGGLKSGDLAIIHFAGHGAQTDDLDGDETVDHMDETIVPWDSRQNSIQDITDDELNALMKELTANGAMVVFILDSCHSASGLRGSSRGIKPEHRTRQNGPVARGTRGLRDRETYFFQPSANYVLVSACKPDQIAGELTVHGKTYGYLTYYMTEILRAAPEPISYEELLEKIRQSAMAMRTSQQPQIEGTRLDAMVFGTTTILRRPTVLVEPDDENPSRVKIAAGQAYGIDKGTRMKVYAPDTREFTQPPIATVRLTEAFSDSAAGVVESGRVLAHSRGVVDLLQRPYAPVRVFITRLNAALRASVAARLADQASVHIVTAPPFEIAAESKNGLVVLRRSDGTIFRDDVPEGCAATAILDQGRWLALLALENPASPLDVSMSILKVGDGSGADVDTVKSGDQIKIKVTNRSPATIYVVLLSMSANGRVYSLGDRFVDGIAGGTSCTSAEIEASLEDGETSTIDHVKVIITRRSISPKVFELQECVRGEYVPVEEDDLQRFLRLAAKGTREPAQLVDAWATLSRNFRTVR